MSTIPVESDEVTPGISRYAALGLLANPFEGTRNESEPGIECEIWAAANRLLQAILAARDEVAPLPIWVDKDEDIPPSYPLTAMGYAERILATDEDFGVAYAYVQLFMFKNGVTRGTLGVFAERLAFRDFERTLVPYVAQILSSVDEGLPSYAALGPDAISAFTSEFEADPLAAVRRVFGEAVLERHEELIEVADMRRSNLEEDGDEDEATEEVDATLGDAPGTASILALSQEAQEEEAHDDSRDLLDYFIDYTRAHLTPVLARALRLYRERGLAAFMEELKITKAPRKTLTRLVELSSIRFKKAAFIYDEFRSWMEVPEDLRSDVADSLLTLRERMAGPVVMVYAFSPGEVPEMEDRVRDGSHIDWSFSSISAIQDAPTNIEASIVDGWFASAALPGAAPLSIESPAFAGLAQAAEGSLPRFIALAYAAIEDAADRGVDSIDDAAIASALSV